MTPDTGAVGVWSVPARSWQGMDLGAVAAELEELGYGAFWVGGSPSGDLEQIEALLAATRTMTVATGVVNVWNTEPAELAASYHRIVATYAGRFILGIGAGHPDRTAKPYQRLVAFLDGLDGPDGQSVPADSRMLAALGPRVLELAARRTAGAHPYLVTPEHTRRAREILGEGVLLAPEQKVLLETDPTRARAVARQMVAMYLRLPNYTGNLLRLGYTEDDLADGGSDALVDALVAWGDEDAIRARVAEHHAAGADHVAIQVLNPGADRLPAHRRLAPALVDLTR